LKNIFASSTFCKLKIFEVHFSAVIPIWIIFAILTLTISAVSPTF